jgi:hypothetical protein
LKVIVETTQNGKLLVRGTCRVAAAIFLREDRVEQFNPAWADELLRAAGKRPAALAQDGA